MVELRNQLAEQERTIRSLVQTREKIDTASSLGVTERSTLLSPLKLHSKASVGSKMKYFTRVSVHSYLYVCLQLYLYVCLQLYLYVCLQLYLYV